MKYTELLFTYEITDFCGRSPEGMNQSAIDHAPAFDKEIVGASYGLKYFGAY